MFTISKTLICLLIFFGVLFVGYLLGRIKIKGIALGTSGIFIIAIVAGCVIPKESIDITTITKQLSNVGLALFITSVGFTAGPMFIQNFKSKAFKYIAISVIIIFTALGVAMLIFALDKNIDMPTVLGITMGALTSTPGLSSNLAAFPDSEEIIQTVNAIAYPFGVLGVCLFVQIVPKILRVNMKEEVEKISGPKEETVAEENNAEEGEGKKPIILDRLGLCVFSLAIVLGILVGALTIPGIKFQLTLTGGSLVVGLLFGHFKKIGRLSLEVPKPTLKVLKELGLAIFLACSGLSGGLKFIEYIQIYPKWAFFKNFNFDGLVLFF